MKQRLYFTLMLLGMISCNQKEDIVSQTQTDNTCIEYSVIEENEISSADLFESASKSLESIPGILGLDILNESFDKAEMSLEPVDTRAGLSPLFYKTVRITYTTKDEKNKDIKASALIVYPRFRKMDKVMLINHGTHMGIAMVPTYYTSVEAIIAASGALCILPDYIGSGESSSHKDLYLNAKVHGTTSKDALLTLLSYAKDKKLQLNKKFDTYILGYSQGGSVSLATLREIQTLSKKAQADIRLKKVICGDGPYDLRCTFESFIKDEQNGKPMGLGSVIPCVINSMFNSYPEEMSGYRYEDFFTPWALSTGVPQAIRDNEETIYDMMVKFNNAMLSEILNMEYISKNPLAYETLMSLMDRQNLCKGWQPVYPLQFFHCNPDGIVSYDNFVNAYKGLKNNYVLQPDTPSADSISDYPLVQHIYGMTLMLSNVLNGKYY